MIPTKRGKSEVEGIPAWYTSLGLGTTGRPQISYWDLTNGDLKYASLVETPPAANQVYLPLVLRTGCHASAGGRTAQVHEQLTGVRLCSECLPFSAAPDTERGPAAKRRRRKHPTSGTSGRAAAHPLMPWSAYGDSYLGTLLSGIPSALATPLP